MTATDELRTLLTTTWQPATAVQRRMEEAGFTVDEARTAKRRLGVSRDLGTVPFIGRKWNWRPPASCVACGRPWRPDGCRGSTTGRMAHLRPPVTRRTAASAPWTSHQYPSALNRPGIRGGL